MNENVEEMMYEEFYEEFLEDNAEMALGLIFRSYATDPRFEKSESGFLEFIKSADEPLMDHLDSSDEKYESRLVRDPRFVDYIKLFFRNQDLDYLTISFIDTLKDKYIDLFIESYRYNFNLSFEDNIDKLVQIITNDYNEYNCDDIFMEITPWTYIDYKGDTDYYSLDGTRMYDYVEDSITSVMKEIKEAAVMYDDRGI
jgi:hypothetical protein